jgi:hypothetical protein
VPASGSDHHSPDYALAEALRVSVGVYFRHGRLRVRNPHRVEFVIVNRRGGVEGRFPADASLVLGAILALGEDTLALHEVDRLPRVRRVLDRVAVADDAQ